MSIKIRRSFLIIAVQLLPLLISAQASNNEKVIVALSKPGKTFKLNISLNKGNIKVITYAGTSMEIEAEPLINKAENKKPDQNQNSNTNTNVNTNININIHGKLTAAETKNTEGKYIIATEMDNLVNIKPISVSRSLNIVIKVPKSSGNFNLAIINTGEIFVTDVAGDIEVNNTNGSINLSNISGSALANSVSGNIIATFRSVNATSAMAFSTLIGKIDITFPADIRSNLKLKTDSGQLFTDFDIAANNSKPDGKPGPKPNPNAGASNQPKFKLNNMGWIYGKINQGGADIMMKNMQGNIYIRKGK